MNVFVFQSVPERYDLREALSPGNKDTWYATRYRNKMCLGDIVFFWMAGDEHFRGLYGWGKITSLPYVKESWSSHGVDVIYESKFKKPVKAHTLKDDPILSKLLILRAPHATNFLLSPRESTRLLKFLKKSGESLPSLTKDEL